MLCKSSLFARTDNFPNLLRIVIVLCIACVPSLCVNSSGDIDEAPSNILFRTLRGTSFTSQGPYSTFSSRSLKPITLSPTSAARVLLFVQIKGHVTQQKKALLAETAGVPLGPYLPENTFMLVGDYSVYVRLNSSSLVEWVGSFEASIKVAPELSSLSSSPQNVTLVASLLTRSPARSISYVRAIASRWAAESGLNASDGIALSESRIELRNVLSSNAARVAYWLANFEPEVFWIEYLVPVIMMNTYESGIVQSGDPAIHDLWDAGVTGTNQIVAIQDSGLDYDSCFFADSEETVSFSPSLANYSHRKVVTYVPAQSANTNYLLDASTDIGLGHGTHVAGIVAGRIVASDFEQGIAHGAKLAIYDVFGASDTDAAIPSDLNLEAARDAGAMIQTNSWGCGRPDNGCFMYDYRCNQIDTFTFNNPEFLVIFAAGNYGSFGPSTVVNPCLAKNTICVGAASQSIDSVPAWSSKGPTLEEGRFKPDVIAPGVNVVSARSDGNPLSENCDTATKLGTSMAAPFVAGSAALVRQYFQDGYYPSGEPNPANSFSPSNSLVKAMIIHSAVALPGTQTPDANQGFGVVRLNAALYIKSSPFKLYIVHSSSLTTLSDFNLCVRVKSKQQPFKITIVWTDYPSNGGSSKALINDLDLQVWTHVAPGSVHYPNLMTSPDRINNVEQIQMATPYRGLHTIIVRGYNVPEGGAQKFSLIVTGLFEVASSCPSIPATTLGTMSQAYPSANASFPSDLLVYEPPNPGDDLKPTPTVVKPVTTPPAGGGGVLALSMGALIGIAIGGGIVVAVLISSLYAYVRSRKRVRHTGVNVNVQPRHPGMPTGAPLASAPPQRLFYSAQEWGRRNNQDDNNNNVAYYSGSPQPSSSSLAPVVRLRKDDLVVSSYDQSPSPSPIPSESYYSGVSASPSPIQIPPTQKEQARWATEPSPPQRRMSQPPSEPPPPPRRNTNPPRQLPSPRYEEDDDLDIVSARDPTPPRRNTNSRPIDRPIDVQPYRNNHASAPTEQPSRRNNTNPPQQRDSYDDNNGNEPYYRQSDPQPPRRNTNSRPLPQTRNDYYSEFHDDPEVVARPRRNSQPNNYEQPRRGSVTSNPSRPAPRPGTIRRVSSPMEPTANRRSSNPGPSAPMYNGPSYHAPGQPDDEDNNYPNRQNIGANRAYR